MNPQIKRLQSNTNEPATGSDSSRPTRRPNSSGNDGLQSWFSAGWIFGISSKFSVIVTVPHGSLHFFLQPHSITELYWLQVQFLLQRRQWELRTTQETKGLHNWVGRRRLNFQVDCFVLPMTWANFNRLRWNVFFLRYARTGFWPWHWHVSLHVFKMRCKRVSGSAFFTNPISL